MTVEATIPQGHCEGAQLENKADATLEHDIDIDPSNNTVFADICPPP